MSKLTTDRKYTVILSAHCAGNSDIVNMIASDTMRDYIEHSVHSHSIPAVGVWKGAGERAFIVHTNSHSVVRQLKQYAFEVHEQVGVLVRNNRRRDIMLVSNEAVTTHIGTHFIEHIAQPIRNHSYTILNNKYYTVA